MELVALISKDKLAYLFFFQGPLMSPPHDVDVKALLSMTAFYTVPTACNRATADLIISNPLFHNEEYKSKKKKIS